MPETEITLADTQTVCQHIGPTPSGQSQTYDCAKPARAYSIPRPGTIIWYCEEHAPKDPQADRIAALEAQLEAVKDQRDQYFGILGAVLSGRGCLAPAGYWTPAMGEAFRQWRETVDRYDQLPDAGGYAHSAIIRQYLDEQAALDPNGAT